jgi:predicted CXXCH cytochrome family protein
MKRILLLLFLSFFVTAQVEDDSFLDEQAEVAAEGEMPEDDVVSEDGESGQTDDNMLDQFIIDEPAPPVAAPVEKEVRQPVQEFPSEEGEQPVSEDQPSTEPEEVEEPVTAQPSPTRAPVDNTKVMVSSSPDLDEAKIGETPDIPLFTHKAHIEDVGAECVQCHQTLFAESVRGIKSGPSQKEICSQCHNGTDAPAELLAGFSDEKKYVRQEMKLFSHTTHIEHTENCMTCHKDIYNELKKIKKVPPMALCMECHNNHVANADCRVCHEDVAKLKPRSHTARWAYRNGHGNRARYIQDKCAECHAERECNQCHRGQTSFFVHRAGYRYSHSMDARQRIANCSYCHETEFSCVQCHSRKQ